MKPYKRVSVTTIVSIIRLVVLFPWNFFNWKTTRSTARRAVLELLMIKYRLFDISRWRRKIKEENFPKSLMEYDDPHESIFFKQLAHDKRLI